MSSSFKKGEIKTEVVLRGAEEKEEKAVLDIQPADEAFEWLSQQQFAPEKNGGGHYRHRSEEGHPGIKPCARRTRLSRVFHHAVCGIAGG